MKQSKLMSWVETCLNTGIGFAIAITAQVLVFPLFGFNPPLATNFYIALIFTVISIVRGYAMRRVFEALHIRRPNSAFVNAVIAERFRQVEQEGWSSEHDDKHDAGELAQAGAAYALANRRVWVSAPRIGEFEVVGRDLFPWQKSWWKATDERRNFVKSAALIIAEGERLDRNRKAAR